MAPDNLLTKIIHNLSLWSYSLYLSHWFLGEALVAVLKHFGWPIHNLTALVYGCLVWVTSLLVSALTYRFFEKPFMDLRDRPSGWVLPILMFRRRKLPN